MSEAEVPQGILLVDKPINWTSFDVVAKIRGIIAREFELKPKRIKVGHTGTLDPLATGLLVLAVGKATKQIQDLTKLDKVYAVDAILGATSETGDSEGPIHEQANTKPPSKSDVETVLSRFEGQIEQIPPRYSAIKVDGQRAYKLARAGKEVKLEPRKVTVSSISNVKYEWPNLQFVAHVSSGTYIRTLVEDVGSSLKTGAYMSGLRRTQVGYFKLDDAISPKELSFDTIKKHLVELR